MEKTPALNRQLAAIVFADIAGYTAMMSKDEAEGRRLVQLYRQVILSELEKHQGKLIKHIGDGSLLIFKSVIDALMFAKQAQNRWKNEMAIPVRIGIHLGDISVEDDDVLGDGVNVASRVESLSIPGSVLITENVEKEIRNHPEFHTKSLGKYLFKNASVPTEVFALVSPELTVPNAGQLAGKASRIQSTLLQNVIVRQGKYILLGLVLVLIVVAVLIGNNLNSEKLTDSDKSIAVLPFVNMSDEEGTEYFCDGVMEDIQTRLSYLGDLKVISRTSSMKYKSTDKDLREIAEELGVHYILEGSVRKSSNQVRINARLNDAQANSQIWSKNYDRELNDIFSIQSEVSLLIANSLHANLTSQDSAFIERAPTQNPIAYQYYLQGGSQARIRTEESLANSVALFLKALEEDPLFINAKAELAQSMYLQGYYAYEDQWVYFPEVEKKIREILTVDPQSYKAQGLLGTLDFFYRRWESSASNFESSLKIKPNDADILFQYSRLMLVLGDFEQATSFLNRATELDPLSPIYQVALGLSFAHADEKVKAEAQINKVDIMFPEYFFNYLTKGDLYFSLGMYSEAVDAYEKLQQLNPVVGQFMTGYMAACHGFQGNRDKALEIMQNIAKENVEYHSMQAFGFIGLNNPDSAFHHLEKGLDLYEVNAAEILHHPIYKHIENHPRFRELLEKAGLYPYWKRQIQG